VAKENHHKDLQSQTQQYYSSGIVPEWLSFVYSDLSESTQFPFGKARELVLEQALKVHPIRGRVAYDIGCGGGQLSVMLARQGFQVRALDFSPAMLEQAQQLSEQRGVGSAVTFRQFDLVKDDATSFGSDGNLAIAMGFIEYLDDIGVFFDKSAHMLGPGGRLLVEFRSRMFNATTGNRFTLADAESNTLERVVESFQSYCGSAGIMVEHYIEVAEAYRLASEAIAKHPIAPKEGKLSEFFPTARHQHFIEEVDEAALKSGLRRIDLFGLHPHPVCPSLEIGQPWPFNQVAWALQQYSRNPLVVSTCSSMASLFELS
jgi:2-polyprenyl-3-methyl-5-hydroxy-6-metoxy-1,4-benzoquinol methylase